VQLTIAVGKEKVTVSDDGGAVVIRCTCGVTDCAHTIAVELGNRAAVNPRDLGKLLAAGRIIERHLMDVTVRLAEVLARLRRDPARKQEADALQQAILDRLAE
jgi:hypothetical protein